MNEIIQTTSSALPLPAPRVGISIRPGTMDDIDFLDELQKKHTKQVGWMPRAQFEGKIKLGHVLIAEDGNKQKLGYAIGNDQYFKHDDIGIIYQLNVVPGKRRHLVGATLLKAMFEKAAWGCKLFCCWCAQDIEANHFWEACGFVPLAFRTGSRSKGKNGTPRVHIFWQKRIREGDTTTPWWFPSQTSGGSIREDRLVLPIPPGTHWSDAKPVVLPGAEKMNLIEDAREPVKTKRSAREIKPIATKTSLGSGFYQFARKEIPKKPTEKAPKPKREKQPKQKNDPKYVAAARELRDRYLENVNHTEGLLGSGKYDVARQIGPSSEERASVAPLQLPLAA